MILQVGEKSDMKPVPSHFPTCGNYMPEPLLDDNNNIRGDDKQDNNSGNHLTESIIIQTIILFITCLIGY